ncbi:MAG: CPBP family intramembrane metalloprotease [Clostridia bacterium]|nr:CPBP family intramembrane metalloprotease [Clostridia bacterium]
MEEKIFDFKTARKTFSIIGFSLCIYIAVSIITEIVFLNVPALIFGKDNWYYNTSWGQWIMNFVPMYLFALPVFAILMRLLPAQKPAQNTLSFGKMFVLFAITYAVLSAGNMIGVVSAFVFSGGKAQNPINELAMDANPLKVVVMVLLAPLFEELIFRKLLLDRIGKYGESTAIILSAFAFGLLHKNLFQLFYAFGVGLIFGFIYMRTGKIRYTVILHMIVNFMGSVIAPLILKFADIDKLLNLDVIVNTQELYSVLFESIPGLLVYLMYSSLLTGITVAGTVLFIVKLTRLRWNKTELELPRGTAFKTAYLNAGIICYVVVCSLFIILSLI